MFSHASGLFFFLPDHDNYLPYCNDILLHHFHLCLFVSSLLLYRDLPLVIVIFPLYFHAFIIAVLFLPMLFSFPPAH